MVFAMFKDEDAILFQYAFLQDEVRNLWQFLECIRRIGKDEIILLAS